MGQLRQMGKQFYDTDIHVEVLSEQMVGDYSHVTMRLNFDNSAYRYIMKEDEEEQEILPITSDFFFEVFPFNIVFRQIISHPNNLFEIMSKEPVKRERNLHNRVQEMESLSAMFKTGLYINDLSMHDSSRDLVLAGTHTTPAETWCWQARSSPRS
ncbi:unnamed protein product [Lampetra planeri]